MNIVFTCREHNQVFESDRFRIEDNRGVVTDENGNRVLDAKVVLTEPCPFCGRRHVYRAAELACPFNG